MDSALRSAVVAHATKMIGKYGYDTKHIRTVAGLPKGDDKVMDCSEFVYAVYSAAHVPGMSYLNSHGIASSAQFQKVETPVAGDIVYWPTGHVAIVENPETGEFIGSQSSTGVARSNYKTNVYWSAQANRAFYALKDPS